MRKKTERVIRMNVRNKLLIVYETIEEAEKIAEYLGHDNYDIVMTPSGKEAVDLVEMHCPDIVLLGMALHDKDGIAVLKSVRRWSYLPVVMYSAMREEHVMVEALDKGADDFVQLPCSMTVLAARLRVALRHYGLVNHLSVYEDGYEIGELKIDCVRRRVYLSGEDVDLSQSEYKLLAFLAKHRGTICTYEYILQQLWGPRLPVDNEILRVTVTKIRRKLKDNASHPRFIFTVPRVGYRMAED